jgi:2-deoxy-D-gluconate 3-dehydrogenase
MRVNLDAVFVLARDIGAYMLTRLPGEDAPHRGSIINVASLVSFQGGLNVPAYAAAKGGVAQLTKSLSNQWASRGINVNAVRKSFCVSWMLLWDVVMADAEIRSPRDTSIPI